jgi:hypothetical protein
MVNGLAALHPEYSRASQAIESMPPDKAIEYLLSKGVDANTAGLVMKNRLLKKAAAQQGQAPQRTAAQEIDDAVNSLAAHNARQGGIANLPVPDTMFNQPTKGMAGGGIVAFDEGGPTALPDPEAVLGHDVSNWFMAPRARGTGLPIPAPTQAGAAPVAPVAPVAPAGIAPSAPSAPGFMTGPGMVTPPVAPVVPPKPKAKNFTQDTTAGGSANVSVSTSSKKGGGDTAAAVASFEKMQSAYDDQMKKVDPGNREDYIAKMQDPNSSYGKATKEYLKTLEDRKATSEDDLRKGRYAAIIEGAAAMSESAQKNPRGGLLAAMAAGGVAQGRAYYQTLKDVRASNDAIEDKQAAAKIHLEEGAMAAYKSDLDELRRMQVAKLNNETRFQDTLLNNDRTLQAARIMASVRSTPLETAFNAALSKLDRKSPTYADDVIALWAKVSAAGAGVQVANINAGQRMSAAQMTNLQKDQGYQMGTLLSQNPDPATAARGHAMIKEAMDRIASLNGATTAPAGGPDYMSAADEILAKSKK